MLLSENLAQNIHQEYLKLLNEGQLTPPDSIQHYYNTFRNRFGPDTIRSLDGKELLETLHDHANRNSLVYWLEFKNDGEFPAIFGSIAGGSALKFIIYRSNKTKSWMKGSPQNQQQITLEEAIEIARSHRDQLIRGSDILAQLPSNASDSDYLRLQQQLDEVAPTVSRLAWGHKYFSLLFPDKLGEIHIENYQRYHLIKLAQQPPDGDGRYTCSGRFVAMARELGMHVNHFCKTLFEINGRPHRYWRIGTSDGQEPRNRWIDMTEANCVAIGWPEIENVEGKTVEQIKELLTDSYPRMTPQTVGRKAREIRRFVRDVSENDIVVAMSGVLVVGIGRITDNEYMYDPSHEFPHQKHVEWISLDDWRLPVGEGLQTTVYEFKEIQNLVAFERKMQESITVQSPSSTVTESLRTAAPALTGTEGKIQAVLHRKSQVILYGPPGTGKTYHAEKTACELSAYQCYGKSFTVLTPEEQVQIIGNLSDQKGYVRLCCFHPSYGYEDFLQGYRPELSGDQLVFKLKDGIFKTICEDAKHDPDHNYYLIIDEINRGDTTRIFGELMTVLEVSNRNKQILLPPNAKPFSIPKNVYIIGTMNTADRSIALLDAALRRRFGFLEMMPDSNVLRSATVSGIPLGPWLDDLNQRICNHIGRDARNLQVGHSYFLDGGNPVTSFSKLSRVIQEDIIPLLEEYCYEDYDTLEKILGSGLVDREKQRIRHELFDASRIDELGTALLEPCSEIVTSVQAVSSDMEAEPEDIDQDDISGSDL